MPIGKPVRPLKASEFQELIDSEKLFGTAPQFTVLDGLDKNPMNKPSTTVHHPSHYNQGKIECIDALRETMTKQEFSGFCRGNAIKYLWRHRDKHEVEDLKKAQVYLGWLIENESNRRD